MSECHLSRAARLFDSNPNPTLPRDTTVKTMLRESLDEPRWLRLRDGRLFYQTGWILLPGSSRKRRYAAVGFSRVEYVGVDDIIAEWV
jgi:hypothetical protein